MSIALGMKIPGERQKTHGDFTNTARAFYALKSAFGLEIDRRMDRLGGFAGFTPRQILAVDQILVKLARIVAGDPAHPDHWRDIAGYALLGAGDDPAAPYWYLASPYRGHPDGFEAATAEAARWAAWLIDIGVEVYSPIVHSHPAAQFVSTAPPEGDFWLDRQKPFMAAAAGLLVAQMPGWDRSAGIDWEQRWFAAAGRPIHAVTADMLGGDGAKLRRLLGLAPRGEPDGDNLPVYRLGQATEAELAEQRESWVRGEMAIGLDRQEAAERERVLRGTGTGE